MRGLRATAMVGVAGLALACADAAPARQDAFDTRITIHQADAVNYRGRVFSDPTRAFATGPSRCGVARVGRT